jgi:hypothetical protein
MTVSYWRELLNRGNAGDRKDPLSELGYRFSIQTDTNETSSPLKGLIQFLIQKIFSSAKAYFSVTIFGSRKSLVLL